MELFKAMGISASGLQAQRVMTLLAAVSRNVVRWTHTTDRAFVNVGVMGILRLRLIVDAGGQSPEITG